MSRNHYEILGVRQSDTDASIRRAMQAAKNEIMADAGLSPTERESRLEQLHTAAEVLTTPAKRDRYDASLRSAGADAFGGATRLLSAPLTWLTIAAVAAIGGGFYWQYERDQSRQRIERQRIAAEEREERRAKEFEAQRVVEKQRLVEELRAQRETDDQHRQAFNEIRSADSQKKQYVADDRHVPPPPTNYSSSYEARRNYEDQRQLGSETQRRAMEENRQRYEDEANLQRAKADVERQKRYLDRLEREDQMNRARRETISKPGQ